MEMVKKAVGRHIIHAVKIGLAGVVSILVARLLRLPQGNWAAISAFVVMGSDVGKAIAASRNRLIGTAIGQHWEQSFSHCQGLAWCGSVGRSGDSPNLRERRSGAELSPGLRYSSDRHTDQHR
jgi:hypothetical protein